MDSGKKTSEDISSTIQFAIGQNGGTEKEIRVGRNSIQTMARNFDNSAGAFNRALFIVKKNLYLALNSSEYPVSLEEAQRKALVAIQNEHQDLTAQFQADIDALVARGLEELADVNKIKSFNKVISRLEEKLNDVRAKEAAADEVYRKKQDEYNAADEEGKKALEEELENAIEKRNKLLSLISRTSARLNAVTNLQKKYRTELLAYKRLASNKDNVYYKTLRYIFNNWSNYTPEEVEDEANLSEEIEANDTKNITESFSTTVKNYLALIPVFKDKKKTQIAKFVPVSTAISTLAELLHDEIDLFDLSKIEDIINKIKIIQNTKLFNADSNAVIDRLLKTLEEYNERYSVDAVIGELDDILPKTITVFLDNFTGANKFNNTFYVIEAANPQKDRNIDVRGMTAEEARYVYGDKVRISKYNSIESALNDLKSKVDETEYFAEAIKQYYDEVIPKLFKISKAFDEIVNIKTYLGSLARMTYVEVHEETSVAVVDGEFGVRRVSKIVNKTPPGTANRIKQNFFDYFLDILIGNNKVVMPGSTKPIEIDTKNFHKTIGRIMEEALTTTDRDLVVQKLTNFLKIFGLEDIVQYSSSVVSGKQFADTAFTVVVAMKEALKEFDPAGPLFSEIRAHQEERSQESKGKVREVMANSRALKFLTQKIAKLASFQESHKKMHAVRGTDNKLLPEFIPTYTYREILKDYIRMKNGQVARYLNSPFFQHNIFVQGIGEILDGETRFLARVSGQYLTPANKISKARSLQLFMSDLFFSALSRTKILNNASYYQPLHQQGLATKSEIPKVRFLGIDKIIDALNTMVDQIEHIDEVSSKYKGYNHETRVNFSIYDKAKKHVEEGLKLNKTNNNYRNELIKHMLTQLMDLAKKTKQEYIDSNLPLHDDISGAYNIIKQGFNNDRLKEGDPLREFFSELIEEEKLKGDNEEGGIEFNAHSGNFKSNNYPEDAYFNLMTFAYIANNYVNSFGVSQFANGDFNQFGSVSTLGKRSQLAISPGHLGILDDIYGMPRTANILLAQDVLTSSREYADTVNKFKMEEDDILNILSQIIKGDPNLADSEHSSIERTDGTIFLTPRQFYKLQKGFGSGIDLRSTIKDQAFGWSEKYIVDESVGFPTLKDLKKYLGKHKVFEGVHFVKRKVTITDRKSKESTPKNEGDKVKKARALPDKEVEMYYPTKVETSPIGLKNAIVVLDDAFINNTVQNAHSREQLRKLRDFLDTTQVNGKPIDMLAFSSSDKTLKPGGAKLFKDDGTFDENLTIDSETHVKQMDMSLFKIQYNPHSTDKTTAVPRQLLHFLSTMANPKHAEEAYKALSSLQNTLFQISFGNKPLTLDRYEKMLMDEAARSNADFTVQLALEAGLSLDSPILFQKVISTLGAKLNKLASRVRLPGGKLILRTDIGFSFTRKYKDENGKTKTKSDKLRIGKTVTGTPYAECSIPEHYLSESQKRAIREGKPLFAVPDMFGFRIPSGDLNAGSLLKVVDFYNTDGSSNIVILPDLEIFKQGWDFDVDALFILRMEDYQEDYISDTLVLKANTLAGFQSLDEEQLKSLQKKYGTTLDFTYDIQDTKQFTEIEKGILNEIDKLRKEVAALRDRKRAAKKERSIKFNKKAHDAKKESKEVSFKIKKSQTEKDLTEQINKIKKAISTLKQARVSILKNRLIKALMEGYLDESNNSRILDVTTTKIIDQAIDKLKELGLFNPDVIEDLSIPQHNIAQFSNSVKALEAIGFLSKGSCISAYLSKASPKDRYPSISQIFRFTIDGKKIKKFGDSTKFFGLKYNAYSLLKEIITEFRDASPDSEIFGLNFQGSNAKFVETAVFLKNFPFEGIALLMNNKIIKESTENNTFRRLMKWVESKVTFSVSNEVVFLPGYQFLNITLDEIITANLKSSDKDFTQFFEQLLETPYDNNPQFNIPGEDIYNNSNVDIYEINEKKSGQNEILNIIPINADLKDYSSRLEGDFFKNQLQKLINELNSLSLSFADFKVLMLMHKIYSQASERQKFLELVDLPQDKPTTIPEIYNFEQRIRKIFKPEAIDLFPSYLGKIPNYLTVDEVTAYIKGKLEKIRNCIRENEIKKSYHNPSFEKPSSVLTTPELKIDAERILDNNPHLAIALVQTLNHIDTLKTQFPLMSDKAIKVVSAMLPQSDKQFLDEGTRYLYALTTLSDLIMTANSSTLLNEGSVHVLAGAKKRAKMVYVSGLSAFANRLILMLQAVQRFENDMRAANPEYVKNPLLEKLVLTPGVNPQIRTTTAISVEAQEIGDYHTAFRELAKYDLQEKFNDAGVFVGYKVLYNTGRKESPIQRDLLTYAILKYGLRGGSSNFVNAIEPSFIAKYAANLNELYNIWISDNENTSRLRDLYTLSIAMTYPKTVTDLRKYSKSKSVTGAAMVTTSYSKQGREDLAHYIGELQDKDMYYDLLVKHVNGTYPPILATQDEKYKSKYTYHILAGRVKIGDETLGLYHKTNKGDVILTPYDYILEDHFRIDKPTWKFLASDDIDLNVVGSTGKIKYNETYHKEDKIKEFVYGVDSGDVVRHRVSILRITNLETYKEDKEIHFEVVESDIGYKTYNPETKEYEENLTKSDQNKASAATKSSFYAFSSREDRFPYVGDNTQENPLGKNDVLVYITNDRNYPISGQATRAFGYATKITNSNAQDLDNGKFAEVGKPGELLEGSAGFGYGLSLNEVRGISTDIKDNTELTEHKLKYEEALKNVKKLILTAQNNPDKKFLVTFMHTVGTEVFNIPTLIKMFIDTKMSLPSNLVFNKSFADELRAEVNARPAPKGATAESAK